MHFMFFEEKISQGKMDTIYIMKKSDDAELSCRTKTRYKKRCRHMKK